MCAMLMFGNRVARLTSCGGEGDVFAMLTFGGRVGQPVLCGREGDLFAMLMFGRRTGPSGNLGIGIAQ